VKKKFLIFILLINFLIIQKGGGATLEEYLSQILRNGYDADYMKGYMQPFSTALGISLGSAAFHRSNVKSFPGFDIGLSGAYIMIPDEAKYFLAPDAVPGIGGERVPTIFGETNPVHGEAVPGFNQGAFILPLLQANIGLFANLEASARYVITNIDYLGRITLYGGGFKYGLSDLIPLSSFPVDMGVQAMYHKFSVDDYIESGAFSMNLQASAGISSVPVNLYGAICFDNSTLVIKTNELNVSDLEKLGDVSIDGESNLRFTIGLSATLLFFNIHADYNFGKYQSIAGGLMFVF